MKTLVIALLDRSWPPSHSFVDGMLSTVLAESTKINVRLYVSRSAGKDIVPRRYKGACCVPILYPRRGLRRFMNFWMSMKQLRYQIDREKGRNRRVVLFVRNDPIYLLAATLLRSHVSRLIFQSSFPHEEFSGNSIKRGIAKLIYQISALGVDAITGVSPIGLRRVWKLCPNAKESAVIPLLSDLPIHTEPADHNVAVKGQRVIQFIYIGTHRYNRELEVVVGAIVQALSEGVRGRFLFVGGHRYEIENLLKMQGVIRKVARGELVFMPSVVRSQIPKLLAKGDVGLTLIPPRPLYYEASPMKLAEYMGAGLAVLANRGIPLQERFVNESQGGLLVNWNTRDIAGGIKAIADNPYKLEMMKENAKSYAEKELQYSNYLPQFYRLMGLKH